MPLSHWLAGPCLFLICCLVYVCISLICWLGIGVSDWPSGWCLSPFGCWGSVSPWLAGWTFPLFRSVGGWCLSLTGGAVPLPVWVAGPCLSLSLAAWVMLVPH